MSRKHVGVDLHTSTTSQVAVRDDEGELLFEPITVKTQPEPLRTAIEAISGEVEVLVEAGTGSGWFRELLGPHVERVIVCHAADNERGRGNKTDKRDAEELSRRLWMGEYTEVYQGPEVRGELREWVKQYLRIVDKIVRAKNQVKALYRKRNIHCQGAAIFEPGEREEWLAQLEGGALEQSIEQLYQQLDVYTDQKGRSERRMVEAAKEREGWESVASLPGLGEIRASKAMGIIGTPWRFPGKRQLWRYSCLAVVVHDSRQWHTEGAEGVVRHHEQVTRGLNEDGRPQLKKIFRGAAKAAIQHYPEVEEDFERRCEEKAPAKAKLDIARKLASQLLTVWKRQEVYDPQKACWKGFSSGG